MLLDRSNVTWCKDSKEIVRGKIDSINAHKSKVYRGVFQVFTFLKRLIKRGHSACENKKTVVLVGCSVYKVRWN